MSFLCTQHMLALLFFTSVGSCQGTINQSLTSGLHILLFVEEAFEEIGGKLYFCPNEAENTTGVPQESC